MGIEKLIPFALGMVLTAAAAGTLPKFVHEIRIAQLQLLKDSQASRWGRPLLLPVKKSLDRER